MNILITGCAGFLGFSLAKKLLSQGNYNILGIDNINKYYSIKLKKKRLSILKQYKKFKFYKYDLLEKNKLEKLFATNDIKIVFHFAAQAGVRYVITNPNKFITSNIIGFNNLLLVTKNKNIKNFFYASSSSVYGDQKRYPVEEKFNLMPKNIYGLSKKFNEEMIILEKSQKTKYIGLRFFTVYGEWGRPDMLILKFLNYADKNKNFLLNNNGDYWRDFTYIDDVVEILSKLLNKKFRQHEIFNICNGNPIHVGSLVNYLSKKRNFTKIISQKKNNIEVYKTHGNNKKLMNKISKKKFYDCYGRLDKIINWYDKYKNLI